MKSYLFLAVIVAFNISYAGNDTLSLENAIELVLKNNYDLLATKANVQIAKKNATYGNAGMLPSINLNSSSSIASYDRRQRLSDNTELYGKGAPSSIIIAGVGFGWTVFDGGAMFAKYRELKNELSWNEEAFKSSLELVVDSVMIQYYTLAKQQKIVFYKQKFIEMYEERMRIAESKWNLDLLSKNDYLQAKAELNWQKMHFLYDDNILKAQKVNMNKLLCRDLEIDFVVSDEFSVSYNPSFEELKKTVVLNNHSIRLQELNLEKEKLIVKQANSLMYPKISLYSNYNFSQNKAQASWIQLDQTLGFNAGVNASWYIYNGGNARRQIANSKIFLDRSNLKLESTKLVVEASLLNAYNSYLSSKEILKMAEENSLIVEEHLHSMMERFKLGRCISLELMQAQQTYELSQVQVIDSKFRLRIAELELMRLNGELVKM